MGVRRPWLAVVLLLIPLGASASDHKFAAFVALSQLDAKGSKLDLTGWHLSGEATIPGHEWLSIAGDLTVHFYGDEDSESEETDPTQVTFAVGPRIERPLGPHSLFLHTMLVGAVYRSGVSSAAGSPSTGAITLGGGFTFDPGAHNDWAFRVQVDYVLPLSNDLGHGWRYSAGVLYRFPSADPTRRP